MKLLEGEFRENRYDVFTEFVLKEICAGSSLESEFWDEFLVESFLNSGKKLFNDGSFGERFVFLDKTKVIFEFRRKSKDDFNFFVSSKGMKRKIILSKFLSFVKETLVSNIDTKVLFNFSLEFLEKMRG